MSVQLDERGFDHILAAIPGALDDAAEQGADTIVELARRRVPVSDEDHTHLIETIKAEKVGKAWEVSAGDGLPDDRAFFVEFGTIHQAAQPYLTPAARDASVLDTIAADVKSKLMG
jgi:HK97 gp10 family phage protein